MIEPHSEKKQKMQKGKLKTSEVQKGLADIRVIQRDVVYVASLPVNIASEETLRKKEFFGQYGKIRRVFICDATKAILNNSSAKLYNVYVTFSKVEEALRCIQVVNGFTLDGRPLKACFGAARYCESWLKNKILLVQPCKNWNCIYLHAVGAQEDTCTKDEVLALCISKLQQLGIYMDYCPRRSGSCFPPPLVICKDNISISRPLPLSAEYGNCHSSKDSHLIGDQGKSDAFQEVPSWGQEGTFGRASYLNVVSQGLKSDPKQPTNSLSSEYEKVQISAESSSTGQFNKELVMVRNHRLLSARSPEKIRSELPFHKNYYSETLVFQDNKAHVDTASVMKDSRSELSSLSKNDGRFQTFVQAPVPSVRVESSKQHSYDSVDCSARMRLENEFQNDRMFFFVPVFSVTSPKQVTSPSESETITANQMIETASICQNVPLTADKFITSSSLASYVSARQLEAENRFSISDIGKVENDASISAPFSFDFVMRPPKGKQNNFQIQSESLGCLRETSKLLQVDLQSKFPSSKDHIDRYSSASLKEDVSLRAVGMIPCKVDDSSSEVDDISDLLSLNLGLNDSLLEDNGLETFNPGMLSNNNASKFSFSRMDTVDHSTNGFWQKENADKQDNFEENSISRNNPLDMFTDGLNDSDDVGSSQYPSVMEVANNSKLQLNLHQSDSLALIQGKEYRLFEVPAKKVSMPSGFSRPATDQNQAHFIPQRSATVFTQEILPQLVRNSLIFNIDSNLHKTADIDPRLTFQSEIRNSKPGLTTVCQNNIKDMALQDTFMNYCGARSSCSASSLITTDPVFLVSGSHSGLEEISRSNLPNWHYEYSREFQDHDDYNFQLPDTSCFYNVALEKI
ncbi:hypothetical protein J5N97_026105 [Dioscorea zingiberensis]|uniref:RRM domain-containing protein n=1 Tax=Dioscorea zingiberensis TaxID=325984 RepID=A0A9D5H6J2_9LILI|nr:hypothetical protein J5N97_026105 [Dioscorea zingiberensis]